MYLLPGLPMHLLFFMCYLEFLRPQMQAMVYQIANETCIVKSHNVTVRWDDATLLVGIHQLEIEKQLFGSYLSQASREVNSMQRHTLLDPRLHRASERSLKCLWDF